jgi:Transcriptional regulators
MSSNDTQPTRPLSDPDALHATAEDLRVLVGKLRRRLREEAHVGDFTPSQVQVLSLLEREGPATVTTLARIQGMRPQSMGETLSVLKAAGLVSGAPDPNDGRQTVLSLTPGLPQENQGKPRGTRRLAIPYASRPASPPPNRNNSRLASTCSNASSTRNFQENIMALTTLDAKTALVVIDLQQGIVALPTAHPTAEVVKRSVGLIDAFRRHGLPVVLVNVAGGAPGRAEQSRPAGDFPAGLRTSCPN